MACLYMITSPSGKSYIGYSARDAESRFSEHVRSSKAGKTNSILHHAIKKYGHAQMEVRTLLVGPEDYCFNLEDSAISSYGTMMPCGYNMIGGGAGLRRMPESVILRRANTLKATMATPEYKSKALERLRVRYATTDAAKNISRSLLEFYSDPENRARASANLEAVRNNPEVQERRIASVRLAAKDADFQKRRTDASTETNRLPERREHKKATGTAMWKVEGHREKVKASFAERFASGKTKRGYIYASSNGKLVVKIRHDGEDIRLGTFSDRLSAENARDAFLLSKGRI